MVLTLIAATAFNKLSTRFSICDFFIFKGLYYYLLEGSLIPKKPDYGNERNRRKKRNIQKDVVQQEDRLFRLPLTSAALEGVPFYDSLIWTINYSCFAILVYLISDLYNLLFPWNRDLNTSMVWMVCALLLQIHVLLRITFEKFSAQLYAERNTLICVFGLFFIGSLLLNAFADKILDLEFAGGYTKFVDTLNDYVHRQGFNPLFSQGARSPQLFLASLSLLYPIILASFFFPILQFTSIYFESLEESTPQMKLLLYSTFLSPACVILLFLRPVVENILEAGMIDHEQLKAIRILAIIFLALTRAAYSRSFLQKFLDQPKNKILEFHKSQMQPEERQRKVAYFASYTCTTALQFYLPVLIVLSTALILKNLGRISILSAFNGPVIRNENPTTPTQGDVVGIIFAKEVQDPLWTLTLTTFLCAQFLIMLIGVVGVRQ